jgi:arginine repressor
MLNLMNIPSEALDMKRADRRTELTSSICVQFFHYVQGTLSELLHELPLYRLTSDLGK